MENVPIIVLSASRRSFSNSAARCSYDQTIQNLRIHKDTKVLCQGFTGKTVSNLSSLFDGVALTQSLRAHSTAKRPSHTAQEW